MAGSRGGWGTRAYHALGSWRPGRLLPPPVARWLRTQVVDMPADDLLEALGALTAGGVDAVVAGGWGIDALIGGQSRRHSDADLVVPATQARLAEDALASIGYQVVDRLRGGRWMPVVVVCRNAGGRTIELQPLAAVPPTSAGTIEGQPVRCLSAGTQIRFHRGYRARLDDRRDLRRLREHLRSVAAATPGEPV